MNPDRIALLEKRITLLDKQIAEENEILWKRDEQLTEVERELTVTPNDMQLTLKKFDIETSIEESLNRICKLEALVMREVRKYKELYSKDYACFDGVITSPDHFPSSSFSEDLRERLLKDYLSKLLHFPDTAFEIIDSSLAHCYKITFNVTLGIPDNMQATYALYVPDVCSDKYSYAEHVFFQEGMYIEYPEVFSDSPDLFKPGERAQLADAFRHYHIGLSKKYQAEALRRKEPDELDEIEIEI